MSISKKIRVNDGSDRSFETITTSELQFDLVPEVGSFRPVTSDGVAKALEVATEIPVVSAETNGKVLTASWNSETGTGSTSWEESQGGVPEYSASDEGKVLAVSVDGDVASLSWEELPKGSVTIEWENKSWSSAEIDAMKAQAQAAIDAGTPLYAYDKERKIYAPLVTIKSAGTEFVNYLFVASSIGGNLSGDHTSAIGETGIKYALGSGNFVRTDLNLRSLPVPSSSDANKVLAIQDQYGALQWVSMPAPATIDQTYDGTSTNAQSGVAVAEAVGAVNAVPAATGADEGKVLTVDNTGAATWATPTAPSGGSDEWWGGDPGRIVLPKQTLRLKFKDLTYDPRNETDTSFTDHFLSITKVEDGVYDFLFAIADSGYPLFSGAFQNKYLTDNEFVVVAFNFGAANYDQTKNMGSMFYGCTGLKAVYNVQDSSTENRNGTFYRAFGGCTGLVYFSVMEFSEGSGSFQISSVSNFSNMFENCSSLVDCNLVISRVSGSADCSYMFHFCKSLVTGPSIDNGVSNATSMFEGCTSLCGFHLNYVLGTFDILADTACNCYHMFADCKSLESSDIQFFLYHTVSNASYMFRGCKKMTTPPRHIKVASGVSLDASYMFSDCWALETVPEMDYGAIATSARMFQNCVMLPDISPLSTVTWNALLTNVDYMFTQCWGIEKGLKDVYDNMAATATITSHSNTFRGCGTAFSNPDLALIPSSWGGTGT